MNKKNIGITTAVATLVIVIIVGGFMYSNQKADAREAVEKQALIASIDAQHVKEDQAKAAKADAPVVSEEYPARIIPKEVPSTTQDASKVATSEATTSTSSTPTPSVVKAILQQSPTPPKVAPTVLTPPPAPQEPVQAITALSEANIQRLQNYPQYGKNGEGFYENFNDFYANERSDCEGFSKRFTPATLSAYNKAKVAWLTSPKLVYSTVLGQIGIRGILTLTYYGDNPFGLTPDVTYQREVEYRLDSSVKGGSNSLSLDSTNYLSGFQAVK